MKNILQKKCNILPDIVGKIEEDDGLFYIVDSNKNKYLLTDAAKQQGEDKKLIKRTYKKASLTTFRKLVGKSISALGILSAGTFMLRYWTLNE